MIRFTPIDPISPEDLLDDDKVNSTELQLSAGVFEYIASKPLQDKWYKLAVNIDGIFFGCSAVAPAQISFMQKAKTILQDGIPYYVAYDKSENKILVWPTPDKDYLMKQNPPATFD
jgi:hypothetical protein